jgi:cobalt-zinc-cadmium efflux system protein
VLIPEMPLSECSSILDAINCALRDRFRIMHTTIQFEIRGCETTHGCSAPPASEMQDPHHHHHGHSHTH